jgi:ankyrin repeat protein
MVIALFEDHSIDMVWNEPSFNYGKSRLLWAADIGRNQAIKQLLLDGAPLYYQDLSFRTPLHWAAVNGHEETVKLLLKSRTLLWAVKNGQKARYIKEDFSCGVAVFDKARKTPLYLAAEKGHIETVRLLLKKGGRGPNGANIGSASHQIRHEKNALDLAAENGHVEVVRLLLSSPDRFCSNSQTRYHVAMKALYWTAKNNQIATAKLLLDEAASLTASRSFPNKVSEGLDGRDAVIAAVANKHNTMLKLLLERKVRAPPGTLKAAAEKVQEGRSEILSILLDWGLKNGGYGGGEKAALLWAAANGEMEMFRLILSYRTDKYKGATDSNGRTALHCAAFAEIDVTWNSTRVYSYSGSRGYSYGHQQIVKYLLSDGEVNIEAKDNLGMTALHYAADGNRSPSNATGYLNDIPKLIIKLLLDHGADRSAKDLYGRLPVHFAAANGNVEMFSLLLHQKSDLNAKDEEGKTPLHYAIYSYHPVWNRYGRGHFSMVKFLLDQGADKDAQDKHGWTPLHAAALGVLESIFDLLQDRGASPSIKDNSGRTAAHFLALRKEELIRSATWALYHGEGNGGIGGGNG